MSLLSKLREAEPVWTGSAAREAARHLKRVAAYLGKSKAEVARNR